MITNVIEISHGYTEINMNKSKIYRMIITSTKSNTDTKAVKHGLNTKLSYDTYCTSYNVEMPFFFMLSLMNGKTDRIKIHLESFKQYTG